MIDDAESATQCFTVSYYIPRDALIEKFSLHLARMIHGCSGAIIAHCSHNKMPQHKGNTLARAHKCSTIDLEHAEYRIIDAVSPLPYHLAVDQYSYPSCSRYRAY